MTSGFRDDGWGGLLSVILRYCRNKWGMVVYLYKALRLQTQLS